MNDERWVGERLRALDGESRWRPNAAAALADIYRREKRRRVWQRGGIWSVAMASTCAAVMFALPAPARCALTGIGCRGSVAGPVSLAPAAALRPAAGYKESGARTAPVVVEIYSDYECPACAAFYTNVFPQFDAAYVKTGKVRVIHRDFPLPQHPFAKLAARYANAAGELGHYDEVVNRLFSDQAEWAATGNVDAAVTSVLPPGIMQKVRGLVKNDPGLDATVASDLAIVGREQINQTPTIIFFSKGKRQKVPGAPSFALLKNYLEEMLKP